MLLEQLPATMLSPCDDDDDDDDAEPTTHCSKGCSGDRALPHSCLPRIEA